MGTVVMTGGAFRWVVFGIDEKNDRPKRIRRSFLIVRGDFIGRRSRGISFRARLRCG